jgi:hypothetical protein
MHNILQVCKVSYEHAVAERKKDNFCINWENLGNKKKCKVGDVNTYVL